MTRVLVVPGVALVAFWAMAHLLSLGPVPAITELVLAWLAGIMAGSALIASLTVLGWGLIAGRTRPAWLRFVAWARSVAAVLGGALVVIGLLYYRETEPRGDIAWAVAGVAVLAGAAFVHVWLAAAMRRHFS